MKCSMILAALGTLIAVAIKAPAQSAVVDFTAAQGYVNGPLHTQNGWWSSGAPTAWQADTSGTGLATISSSEGDWKKIVYDLPSDLRNGYKASWDFRFQLSNTAAITSSKFVVLFDVEDSNDSYHGPGFELKAQPAGGFTIGIWNNASSTGGSTGISATGMGLTADGSGTSARLRLSATITNAGAGTWTTVLTLTNLDTSTGLGTVTDAGWTGQGWATHSKMEAGELNTVSGSDGWINVDRFLIEPAVAAPSLPPPSTVIEFNAAQGYESGDLNGQVGFKWSGSASWQVDTNGSGLASISSSAGDWRKITFDLGSASTNGYNGTFDFSFTNLTAAAAERQIIICKVEDSANGYMGPAFEFKATVLGGYVISIWNEVSGGFVKKSFGGSAIGMTGGTGASAKLRMAFTTTPAGAGTWTTVYTLQNLDTAATVATVSLTAWAGQGWASHLGMEEGMLNTITGNEGLINVDRITMGSLTAPELPVITIQNLGKGQFSLQWTNGGTLLETTNVASGTWLPIPSAASPYANSFVEPRKFYRVQVNP